MLADMSFSYTTIPQQNVSMFLFSFIDSFNVIPESCKRAFDQCTTDDSILCRWTVPSKP